MSEDHLKINKQKEDNLAVGAKGGAIAFSLKISSAALALINQIVLARILGAGGMGEVVLAISIVYMASLIAKFGMEDAMMRFVPEYIEKKESAKLKGTIYFTLKFCSLFSLSLILIVMFLSEIISLKIFHYGGLVKLLPIAAIAILASVMRGVMGGILKGYKDTFRGLLPELFISPFTRLIIFLLLSIRGGTPVFAIYAFVAGEIIAAFLSTSFLLKRVKEIKTKVYQTEYKKVLDVGVTMIFSSVSLILFTQVDIWIVGIYINTEAVGIYGVVSKLVSLIILPLGTFSAIIPPLMASIYTSGNLVELRKIVSESTRWILSVSMPIILILILEGDLILKLIFGAKFISGYTALLILAVGQLINASTGLVGYLLQMTGGHRTIMKINIFWGILNVIFNIVLVPRFGIIGAAISTAFCLAMGNVTAVFVVYNQLSVITLAKGLKFDILFAALTGIIYFICSYNEYAPGKHILLFFALIIYIWKSIAKNDLPWRLLISKFKET